MRVITLSLAAATALGLAGAAPASATADAAQRHSATEHFSIISTTDPSTDSVIATGLFTAGGTDHAGARVDKINLPDGSFEIKHRGHGTSKLNAKTCLLTTKGRGTYTLGDGTGAYKTIKGHGKYTEAITVTFLKKAKGGCKAKADPSALQYVVTGTGPASLPVAGR